jgi:hypothetical protein
MDGSQLQQGDEAVLGFGAEAHGIPGLTVGIVAVPDPQREGIPGLLALMAAITPAGPADP